MNEFWQYFHSSTEIFDVFLKGTNSDDEELSIECCEFWALYTFIKTERIDLKYFSNFLPQLCPALLRRCRFTPDILAQEQLENDHQSKPDKVENIKPRHYNKNKYNNNNNGFE